MLILASLLRGITKLTTEGVRICVFVRYEFMCGRLPFGHDRDDQLGLYQEIVEVPKFISFLASNPPPLPAREPISLTINWASIQTYPLRGHVHTHLGLDPDIDSREPYGFANLPSWAFFFPFLFCLVARFFRVVFHFCSFFLFFPACPGRRHRRSPLDPPLPVSRWCWLMVCWLLATS